MLKDKEAFLALVRLGIGNAATVSLPDRIDWVEVEALAVQHGLLGVVVDGVEKLPDSLRPPKLILLRWIGMVMQNEASYNAQQKASAELAFMFHNNGIRTYVLKGAIVAECYPKPSSRLSADLDCFLVDDGSTDSPQENDSENNVWENGNQVIENAGFEVKRNFYKNSTFLLPGLTVENHRFLTPFRGNKTLRKLEQYLQKELKEGSRSSRFEGSELWRPPVMVSALFLIEHAYSHFLHEGLNWRYVLDWMLFSRKHEADINWPVFDALVDDFGFRRFYDSYCRLGKCLIGEIQDSSLTFQDRKMLADVWSEKKKHKSDSGFKGKMTLAANTWNASWKYRHFSPISMPRALWIQVKGYLFDKNPTINN